MHSDLTAYLASTRLTFERGWRHAAAGTCSFHSHPPIEIVYHVVGSGATTDARGTTTVFAEGGVIIYAPGLAHNQRMNAPGEDVCIHVGSDLPWPADFPCTLYVPPPAEARLKDELLALASLPSGMGPGQQLACDHRAAALLIELLHRAEQSGGSGTVTGDRMAAAARDYIRSHYRDIRDLPAVAAVLGVGYDHLRHGFRKTYGMSLKQWHTQVRIGRARDLLLHSHLPLKAIADLCGFETARYFSTCYRRATGQPPGACRVRAGSSR